MTVVAKVLMYDQYGNLAPSGGASNEQIKAMRGKCYNQVYQGFNLSKDSMALVDRSAEEF